MSQLTETGMMTGIKNVSDGWHELVRKLDADLKEIDPEYELLQVKEKFGTLRYYASFTTEKYEEGMARIGVAEAESAETCEVCGTKEGVTTASSEASWWMRTLCPGDREAHDARMVEKRQGL